MKRGFLVILPLYLLHFFMIKKVGRLDFDAKDCYRLFLLSKLVFFLFLFFSYFLLYPVPYIMIVFLNQ